MILYSLDLLGTAVFAITGVLAGCRRDMDLFGVMVLGFVTAIGGGTIRDMLLTGQAVFWTQELNYLYVCLISIALGLLALKRFHRFEQPLLIMDAIGLATFTIIGVEKTLALEFAPMIAVCMGVLTGAGGGVIRDLLSGHAPLILSKSIYATASMAGGITFVAGNMIGLPAHWLAMIASVVVFLLRLVDIRHDLSLPRWSIND